MKGMVLLLALTSTAQAREELHYFTSTTCKPCIPVTKIVTALNNHDRDITVHVYQQNEAPFKYYGVDFIPAFLVIEDGKVKKRYVQENVVGGFRFTPSFVSGIAPFKSKALDPAPIKTARDCANPIGKPFRNLIPPPPAPLPDDVPDRIKVKRIEDLEKIVEDQNKTISVLNRNLDKLTETMTLLVAQVAALPEPKPGKDGQDGKQGPPGQDGVDNRPIDLILEFVDDTGKVVATDQKTYPRGTPLVLRFSEKLLKE